ncbi:MAG: hypothetical protein WA323_07710 [Candidatus Nitrosopolaris sp.]
MADGAALELLADGAALELLADGAALELLADGAALELLADGATLELLADGAALVLLAVCANACCENCIPTMVKDVRSIAEIAIADSVVTFAYVFLCIRPQGLGMKFICFLPLIKKTASVIFYTRFTYFCKILGLANIL